MVYHVAYDLNAPGQNYHKVIAEIEKRPAIRILESSWLVDTSESARQLRDSIQAHMDRGDRVFISMVSGANFSCWLDRPAAEWLRERC